jgi:formylglycine-generating enzyme required for sulfatase activity
LAGTIYEWCVNGFEEPQALARPRSTDDRRVLRGGSWYGGRLGARCSFRGHYRPVNRDGNFGFRVLCSSPILVL